MGRYRVRGFRARRDSSFLSLSFRDVDVLTLGVFALKSHRYADRYPAHPRSGYTPLYKIRVRRYSPVVVTRRVDPFADSLVDASAISYCVVLYKLRGFLYLIISYLHIYTVFFAFVHRCCSALVDGLGSVSSFVGFAWADSGSSAASGAVGRNCRWHVRRELHIHAHANSHYLSHTFLLFSFSRLLPFEFEYNALNVIR